MTRWVPGADPIAVARLAATESADRLALVAVAAPKRTELIGGPRCAARYAHLWGKPLDEAARDFGVSGNAVLYHWDRLYPGVPIDPMKRGGR